MKLPSIFMHKMNRLPSEWYYLSIMATKIYIIALTSAGTQ
jgi:hypothetical protein